MFISIFTLPKKLRSSMRKPFCCIPSITVSLHRPGFSCRRLFVIDNLKLSTTKKRSLWRKLSTTKPQIISCRQLSGRRCLTFAECRVQTADCRVQTADCRLQTTDCRLQTAERRPQTADCRPETADYR